MDLWKTQPDIARLTDLQDIRALMQLLGHRNPTIQWNAAEALGRLGEKATPFLISILENGSVDARLGAIEALGDIRDPAAVGPLIYRLADEENEEIRWAIVLTLGQIGDPEATDVLVENLTDPSKYVRYGAALSLDKIRWKPGNAQERTRYFIALQRWEIIPEIGEEALGPLVSILSDGDGRIREKAVETLGALGTPKAEEACDKALADPSGEVRWKALLSLPKCGLPISHLTRGLTRRPKTGQSPVIAAFLNLLFPGIGYNYLGKWYGFLLFQINLAMIVILSLLLGPVIPYVISYSFGSLVGVHAWNMAKALPDLP
jgi:HEAT repeat protein